MLKEFSPFLVYALAGLVWLTLLACRVTDVIAQNSSPATNTPTRPQPTFTFVAQLIATDEPPIAVPPSITPTQPRPPTPRPAPTRVPATVKPPPPPPTPDPYAGYYYKPVNKGCVAAPNTRIQGTVIENGIKKNGVRLRVSNAEGGDPVIEDFITGIDPADYKHIDPSLQGQYRLGIAEGAQIDGNWWVFVLDNGGNRVSPGFYVKTHDANGCNTATIDFVH